MAIHTKAILKLLFAPNAFVRRAIEHDRSNANQRSDYEPECKSRVERKRKGVLISLWATLGVCVAAILTATILTPLIYPSEVSITIIRFLAVTIIAWSVLSRLGYDVETWNGETLLEKTSLSMFKLFYLIGIFLAIVGLFSKAT